jgi:predicted lipoprotein with Yx(FWY)xxD motif
MAAGKRRPLVKLDRSQFGAVLFSGSDRALYLCTRDPRNKNPLLRTVCRGVAALLCQAPAACRRGVDAGLLGTITRRDGRRQMTYRGHALYFYVHDPRGEVLCNDVFEFGGTWFALDAQGEPPS